jgi:predicted ATPase
MTEFITKEEAAKIAGALQLIRYAYEDYYYVEPESLQNAINEYIEQKFDFIGTAKLWNKGGSGEFISVEWEDKPEHDSPLYALKGDSK